MTHGPVQIEQLPPVLQRPGQVGVQVELGQREVDLLVELHRASHAPGPVLKVDKPLEVDNEEVWLSPHREGSGCGPILLTNWTEPRVGLVQDLS